MVLAMLLPDQMMHIDRARYEENSVYIEFIIKGCEINHVSVDSVGWIYKLIGFKYRLTGSHRAASYCIAWSCLLINKMLCTRLLMDNSSTGLSFSVKSVRTAR